jgi:Domain of unknown function (DUF4145)
MAKGIKRKMAKGIKRCFCNLCGRETDHDVVWQDVRTKESSSEELFEIELLGLQCRGCKECTILKREREIATVGLAQGLIETYEPPRLWRRAPDWLSSLQSLNEIYSATNVMQVRLLSMGVRSALDHVMDKILGADMGSFSAKLNEMVKRGHLTSTQKDNLEIVIDAGSASAHRGFKPSQDLLDEMLAVMESIIRNHYITGPMLKTAKTLIPPRP